MKPHLARPFRIVLILIATLAIGLAGCTTEMTPTPSGIATPTPVSSPSPTARPSPSPPPSPSPTPIADRCPGTDKTPGKHVASALSEHSENWAGYIAYSRRALKFTCVEGSWKQPTVTCPSTGIADVAIWVGIDGVTSPTAGIDAGATLVQIGTEAGCRSGTSSVFAWYQVIPDDPLSVTIDALPIAPGDTVHAMVSYTDGSFTLQIVDKTTGDSFALERELSNAARLTVEWVVEAPMVDCPASCHIAVLPKFTTLVFTSAYAAAGTTRSSIDDDAWRHGPTEMIRSGIVRAAPSKLSSGGTSFSVTWKHR